MLPRNGQRLLSFKVRNNRTVPTFDTRRLGPAPRASSLEKSSPYRSRHDVHPEPSGVLVAVVQQRRLVTKGEP